MFLAKFRPKFFSGLCCTGNMRSALNDAAAAKKIKPDHLKALIRGVYYTHTGFPLQH